MNIIKPTLIVDKRRCLSNIEKMAEKAAANNTKLRPHFKTHQSKEIGRWFKRFNIQSITVSSLDMAEYFAEDWDDITVAFPFNQLEIAKVNRLAEKIKLNLLVESMETILFLSNELRYPVGFFIKIDVGTNRTGVQPDNKAHIDRILQTSEASDNLVFKGFLCHAGHSYRCRSEEEIIQVHETTVNILDELKIDYLSSHPDMIISVGDTPTCSVADDFFAVDEMRPGNFVFYDIMQEQIASCSFDEIAVSVACPIVALHLERNECVIYGGGVHFSKDFILDKDGERIYGRVIDRVNAVTYSVWPDAYIKSLSQEHGIVQLSKEKISELKVGDILYVLPVHSCMTMNLLRDDHEIME